MKSSRASSHHVPESEVLGEKSLCMAPLWTERHSGSYGLKEPILTELMKAEEQYLQEPQAKESEIQPRTGQSRKNINSVA